MHAHTVHGRPRHERIERKSRLDSDVQLLPAHREPNPTAPGQRHRLRHLVTAALATWADAPRPYTDEIDVLPLLWVAASAVAVTFCLAGVVVGRARHRRDPTVNRPYASG